MPFLSVDYQKHGEELGYAIFFFLFGENDSCSRIVIIISKIYHVDNKILQSDSCLVFDNKIL